MTNKMPTFDPAQGRRSGLPIAWTVDEAHIIRRSHGCTVLAPVVALKAPHLYSPSTRLELPGELAKLERGNKKAVIKFADTYGLLGYSNLLPTKEFAGRPVSDPVEWIWSHAETVQLALTLKDVLDQEDAEGLERTLKKLEHRRLKHQPFFVTFAARGNVRSCSFFPPSSHRRLAASILETIVNENISGIHPEIAWDETRGIFVQYSSFSTLIEAVYWHLSNVMSGGRVTRCETCGGRFIQTDRRQRFCPTGTKQESPCAVKARVREWREQRKRK